MKKTILAALLVVGLATGLAYAHGNGWGGGYGGYGGHMMGYGGHMMGNGGYGMMGPSRMGPGRMGPGMMNGYGGYGNCPGAAYFDQNGWNGRANQKFLQDTVSLRKELNDKRFEYREAMRSPDTSREQLDKIGDQISNIERQLQDKAQEYQ